MRGCVCDGLRRIIFQLGIAHCEDDGVVEALRPPRQESPAPRVRDHRPRPTTSPCHNGHGIGLKNARERLSHFYHDEYSMQAHPLDTGGFEVAITIPYERRQPKMKLKALIADDEPLARERLRYLLSRDEEIEIVGECRNGKEVVAALKENPVDLLFLDIEMPGANGFHVIEEVGLAHMPLTVFVTAHNQYAVKAFEIHALDYLTKPVEPERLQASVSRSKSASPLRPRS